MTLHLLKRIELEVLALENELRKSGDADLRLFEVHPRQFHGIEVKPWAREIAELTLWIGYHQFWKQHRHVQYPEPILEDTGTIECRDAVLAWDEIRHDPSRDRPDPTPRIVHPVTGALVPDPGARLPYMEYVNPRQAEWPKADFIVGNPPYLGKSRKRMRLGDGYVDGLLAAYPQLPAAADLVMYWWYRASLAVLGSASRAGLITTNSITQKQNRSIVEGAAARGADSLWAIRDHPWVDEVDGASVRVAMTVFGRATGSARLLEVDERGDVLLETVATRMNSDLTVGANVPAAAKTTLLSNEGLATVGFKLYGDGFVVSAAEVEALCIADSPAGVLRPWVTAMDLTRRPRHLSVIDFGDLSIEQAETHPVLFDIVRSRVHPHREANRNEDIKARWWQFGHRRGQLRQATVDVDRFIVTPETARHRFFVFLPRATAPEGSVFCIASDEAIHLGVLSSRVHMLWAAASAGKLGVGNDYRYNKDCFDPFPFPVQGQRVDDLIAEIASKIDEHRVDALARDERVTMTGIYNVVDSLRSGATLSPKERSIHELAACGVLRDLHDELDALVAQAYGWPWPMEKEEMLERLVALHDERVAEEKAGKVRWLRPEYQIPRFGKEVASGHELGLPAGAIAAADAKLPAWPRSALEQLGAIKAMLATRALSAAEVGGAFDGASAPLVERHLETLALMGELVRTQDAKYTAPSQLSAAA